MDNETLSEALIEAVQFGDILRTRALLNQGADPGTRLANVAPVLGYAARQESDDVLSALLEHRAQLTSRDLMQAVMMAFDHGDPSPAVERLLREEKQHLHEYADKGTGARTMPFGALEQSKPRLYRFIQQLLA